MLIGPVGFSCVPLHNRHELCKTAAGRPEWVFSKRWIFAFIFNYVRDQFFCSSVVWLWSGGKSDDFFAREGIVAIECTQRHIFHFIYFVCRLYKKKNCHVFSFSRCLVYLSRKQLAWFDYTTVILPWISSNLFWLFSNLSFTENLCFLIDNTWQSSKMLPDRKVQQSSHDIFIEHRFTKMSKTERGLTSEKT